MTPALGAMHPVQPCPPPMLVLPGGMVPVSGNGMGRRPSQAVALHAPGAQAAGAGDRHPAPVCVNAQLLDVSAGDSLPCLPGQGGMPMAVDGLAACGEDDEQELGGPLGRSPAGEQSEDMDAAGP
eukprot:CAMPEP_0202873956 /NCGR_PEP_ID=MMETSP1391-20130828/24389_1 /ASSEMBLY_ACC=CAM_ASM_000867 /TAXON_ID=1034604 /ORGANISM="Chlamydomonas leiostraca, Strain SAG 11-49" /LENGTH=124 /DNA_ID=CAMNT_0049555277 /DNA_START=239 /DNA_END=609 /DNA_ORIENTATION=-